jgi:uncharacterized glyoxalase superfamily protein PhnB
MIKTKEFYTNKLGAKVLFDCGWYIDLSLGVPGGNLQFMSPQSEEQKLCNAEGLVYNILVDDVDAEHEKIRSKGLDIISPLTDNPWGDKSFAIKDPNGILLYIYSLTKPAKEFEKYFKE